MTVTEDDQIKTAPNSDRFLLMNTIVTWFSTGQVPQKVTTTTKLIHPSATAITAKFTQGNISIHNVSQDNMSGTICT